MSKVIYQGMEFDEELKKIDKASNPMLIFNRGWGKIIRIDFIINS